MSVELHPLAAQLKYRAISLPSLLPYIYVLAVLPDSCSLVATASEVHLRGYNFLVIARIYLIFFPL